MNKGIFCISIDHEFLWGRKDLNYNAFVPKVKSERKIIAKILKLFKKYDIPATWAVVGKILEKGDSLWHGPNSVREIKKDKNQEIASHSYSHKIFTEIGQKVAREEIEKLKAKSFVFPRNKIAYIDLLKKYGFKCFRGRDKTSFELLIPRIPPVYKPKLINGVVEIPGSMYLVSGRGFRKFIPKGLRFIKAKWGIDSAIGKNKVFHLWFHPIDFVDDSKKIFSNFEQILAYAAKKRKQKVLEIKTMNEVASSFLSLRYPN